MVTTNYDNALECCYSSILSYSYKDLNTKKIKKDKKEKDNNTSWLFRAVSEKLKRMNGKINGRDMGLPAVTVPDMPMLLKVHGSIERADDIALSRAGYDKAYNGEMPILLKKIFKESTLIFLGYGLREDRVMDELKKLKEESNCIRHFAFLPEEQKSRTKDLTEVYGIYPIYYSKKIFENMKEDENTSINHDYFLGLLLENLTRRKKGYPQPLELLWEKDRFNKKELSRMQIARKRMWEQRNGQYVRRKEALQIWKVLNFSEECPLIAITGENGSGKSILCESIQELQKGYSNAMQFFYISLVNCKNWDEFCIQIFQELNIVELEIPPLEKWREFAEKVADRCGVYWRSVLILDYMDNLKEDSVYSEVWETIKKILKYWKEHKTRVIFVCRDYPDGIPCYTWHLGELGKEDATKIFFSACTSRRTRDISYLEKKIVTELFTRQIFQPSSIDLLGEYANSKNDLTSLLEEWALYHLPGDTGEQTLARILWNHLLDEHHYEDKDEAEKNNIQRNILWVWGILGCYPGPFPNQFFKAIFDENENEGTYKSKRLTEKSLRYMKNIGLCEEQENRREKILLGNIVNCVDQYFFKVVEENQRCKNIRSDFGKIIQQIKEKGQGLECFRGYVMHEWEEDLRKLVWRELKEQNKLGDREELNKDSAKDDILKILRIVGEKIQKDKRRTENQELNMILHYEIKTVIRFLRMCISQPSQESSVIDEIIEIGYCFSRHYHYVPSHSFPLVSYLLKIMESRNYDKGDQENNLYKIAEINRVMGDIQRLLGRKEEAIYYYHKCIDLCHNQILAIVDKEKNSIAYEESCRIKARVLLISYYYRDMDNNEENGLREALDIYNRINDKWGKAYYNQRMGEIYCASNISDFNNIKKYYQNALKLYEEIGDETGCAYIWKSEGDLIVKYKNILNSEKKDWFEDAVQCYLKSFQYYYSSINWRGFANVIQAMGTCCRNGNIQNTSTVGVLYGLAEETYRWLGDIRGLADTLDYSGYEYRDSKDEAHKYMALSQWMESRKLWKKQGNEKKAEEIENEIKRLDKSLFGEKKNE